MAAMPEPAFDPGPAPTPAAAPLPAAPAVPEVPANLLGALAPPEAAPAPDRSTAAEEAAGTDTAAEVSAFGAWARATFTPPDFWHQPTPSAAEEAAFARASEHLPEQGPWRAAAAAYGTAAAGVITGLLALVWIVRAPARAGVGALVAAAVLITAALTL